MKNAIYTIQTSKEVETKLSCIFLNILVNTKVIIIQDILSKNMLICF